VITIDAPQGTIIARPEGKGNPFSVVVRQKGKSEILHRQESPQPHRYIAGEYEVESLTLPRRIFPIRLEADKTVTISLPSTAAVNINTLAAGYGSLFEILETGETKWVCSLDETKTRHFLNLLPGNYKLAFRARQTRGSKYTAVKYFTVTSGQTLNVKMF
jgi:Ca-activated chloride channel family protein